MGNSREPPKPVEAEGPLDALTAQEGTVGRAKRVPTRARLDVPADKSTKKYHTEAQQGGI